MWKTRQKQIAKRNSSKLKRGKLTRRLLIRYKLVEQSQITNWLLQTRDSVKIMALYGRKAINNFPTTSQKINYFPNFERK